MPPSNKKNAPTPERILQLGMGFWASKTVLTAVTLGVFTTLAKGPRSLGELRKAHGLHERGARDFFDALVALGLLRRAGGRYLNTPESDLFLDKKKPSYIGGLLEMSDRRLYRFWGDLEQALRTGKPQNEIASGEPGLFENLYGDPARLKEFLRAMTGVSLGSAHAIAAKFPWKRRKSFVDVGCAQGAVPAVLARAHPHLHGLGADLPVVEPVFREHMKEAGVADRVGFKPVDFFKDELPKADVLIMGHILHDWDLAQKKALIKKAYAALPKGGAFIVYEALIDDKREKNAFGLLMSLNMLIETPGGFDYTGAEGSAWMKAAGFKKTEVVPLTGPDSMLIGYK